MASENIPAQSSMTKGALTIANAEAFPSSITSIIYTGKEQPVKKEEEHSWKGDEESDGGVSPVNDEPINSIPTLQRWNSPRINAFRTLATFWDFMILGANDAVYG